MAKTIRERFEDVLFETERDHGMSGVYALVQALAAQLTAAQLLAVMRDTGGEE